jgi:hypothetical protein
LTMIVARSCAGREHLPRDQSCWSVIERDHGPCGGAGAHRWAGKKRIRKFSSCTRAKRASGLGYGRGELLRGCSVECSSAAPSSEPWRHVSPRDTAWPMCAVVVGSARSALLPCPLATGGRARRAAHNIYAVKALRSYLLLLRRAGGACQRCSSLGVVPCTTCASSGAAMIEI